MLPNWWVGLVLTLGAYRLVRLIGWDDLPPIRRLRSRLVGETRYTNPTESREPIFRYDRPLLWHFLNCAFCQGFWISLVVYLAWRFEPVGTIYAVAPFALSGAVGLIAKNLDA